MVKLPQAVLLDLDDTILDDTGGVISHAGVTRVAHIDRAMNGLDPEVVFDAIDRMREWVWSDPERHRVGRLELAWARGEVVRLALADLGVDDPRSGATDRRHISRESGPGDQAVRRCGRHCRVAASRDAGSRCSPTAEAGDSGEKIDRFGLARLFDAILIEGEVGFGKPDPRIYTQALDDARRAPQPRRGWLATTSNGTSPVRSARGSPASGSTREAAAFHPEPDRAAGSDHRPARRPERRAGLARCSVAR